MIPSILYTPKLTCKFSTLSLYFLQYCQREFVWQSGASSVGDHLLYSRYLYIWNKANIYCKEEVEVNQLKGLKGYWARNEQRVLSPM